MIGCKKWGHESIAGIRNAKHIGLEFFFSFFLSGI